MADTDVRSRLLTRLRQRRKGRPPGGTMTIVDHLRELRTRLIRSLVAFFLISVVAFVLYEPIFDIFKSPLCGLPKELQGPQGCNLIFIKVLGGFNFRLKLTALVGLAGSAPIWLYQVYAFILPGLTPREKRYSFPFIICAVVLFAFGATFAYFLLGRTLEFLIRIGGEGLTSLLGAEEYLNFFGLMILGFGVTFEMPLLLIFLALAGVITAEQLRHNRRLAVVLIFVLAAVVTPSQDPYTMSMLAIPLYVLYEATILVVSRLMKAKAEREGS